MKNLIVYSIILFLFTACSSGIAEIAKNVKLVQRYVEAIENKDYQVMDQLLAEEYVGFGPGNYSTAFPDKQDRQISAQEELLAQSTKREGGINFYTGMNDRGISYAGNKKLSTITGKEEIFPTLIP